MPPSTHTWPRRSFLCKLLRQLRRYPTTYQAYNRPAKSAPTTPSSTSNCFDEKIDPALASGNVAPGSTTIIFQPRLRCV